MKEDNLGGLGLPVGLVGSLVIIYWGGSSGRWGGARDVGYGRGSGVVCNYDVISYDLILFKILFRFCIAVESRVEVVFSSRYYLTIIF